MSKVLKVILVLVALSFISSAGALLVNKFLPDLGNGNGDGDNSGNTELKGNYSGQIYKNEYFNLSLHLPKHWHFETEESINNDSLTFYSDRTIEELEKSDFFVDCRAVNNANNDIIEIAIETISSEHLGYSGFNFNTWRYRCGYFDDRPETLLSQGECSAKFGGRQYTGLRYLVSDKNTSEIIGKMGIYFKNEGNYLISITIISDDFYGEDGQKDYLISRMIDWFGTFHKPATSFLADEGGYYLNDIIGPSDESNMFYTYYLRDELFTIQGLPYYDCIPLHNGNNFGVGKTKDVVYNLDGTTYTNFSFTVGNLDTYVSASDDPKLYAAFEIILDGKQVFEERHYSFEKVKKYQIDITGARKMIIRIRDNWELTSIVLADPIISTEEIDINETIPPVLNTVDFLENALYFCRDNGVDIINNDSNKTFTVNGKKYSKGIILHDSWGHSNSVYFNLCGQFEQLNFSTGVIEETLYSNGGWLNVYLDGIKILDVELDYHVPIAHYSLDVKGGHILSFECDSGIDYGIHQADFALINMTLGEPIKNTPTNIEPGSYKLISEIGEPFSTKSAQVYDGSTKFRGHYLGDIFYNEGISMESIYSLLGSPIEESLPATAAFALGKNFKYATFTIGRVDRSHIRDDVMVVVGDGVELARYTLVATAFPKEYELNVEGVDVLEFRLLGTPNLTRGKYMVADIAVHTDEITNVEFSKPIEEEFPNSVFLMDRFSPYEYMSAEGNGHDAVRYFNGIYDGTDNRKYFTIDRVNHTKGLLFSTSVYLSLDNVAGGFGMSLCTLTIFAIAASSEVSQASFACFNLQNQYSTLTFNIGVVDGQDEIDRRQQPYDTFYVIADEEIVGEYRLTGDMATMSITVDIKNCKRLAFWLDHNRNSYTYGLFDAKLEK